MENVKEAIEEKAMETVETTETKKSFKEKVKDGYNVGKKKAKKIGKVLLIFGGGVLTGVVADKLFGQKPDSVEVIDLDSYEIDDTDLAESEIPTEE